MHIPKSAARQCDVTNVTSIVSHIGDYNDIHLIDDIITLK